jgi:two-component SAPR family response regulator
MAVGYLAQNLCTQGRIDEARQLAEATLWEQAANPNTYEMVVTRSVLADIALESNDLEGAQAIFESLEEICERRQFRIPLAMVYFGLAYIHQQNGRSQSALDYAQKSVAILAPLGTSQLFLDQGERARTVCQILVDAGETTPFVAEVLQRLPGVGEIEVVERETAVYVQCLGEFRIFVDGSEITQEQWVSTKARDMLAYFVTHRQKHIPLEKATADIWPDQDQQGRAFHSALYRLRQALRQGNEKTKFINVKSGEYWLDRSQFTIDVDEFETAVTAASHSTTPESATWRKKAVSVYGGDYMSNLLYYDWTGVERRRLEDKFVQLLSEAAADQAQGENYTAALDLINRAIEQDALRENFYCQAMNYYAAMNNRSGLIRCYQMLSQELLETLNLSPSPTTQQHYQHLLSLVK